MARAAQTRRRTAVWVIAGGASWLAFAVATPGHGAVAASSDDTGVVLVSDEPGIAQGEEPLAVNPLNPDEMTAVANVYQPNVPSSQNPFVGGGGLNDTRLYTTQDGGRHWTTLKLDQGGLGRVVLPLPVGGAPEFSDALNVINSDAASIWDRHGNAYFESGDVHGIAHNGDEVETVWRSTDGGRTWGPSLGYTAVNATREEHTELDRPWLAVDTSGGPLDGRLYTTFETTPFADIPPEVYAKYSDDHGATWSPSVRVDDGIYTTQWNARARPVLDDRGALDIVYDRAPITATPYLPYDGPIELVLARSTDGGHTFTRTVIDTDVRRVVSPDEATPQYTEMIGAIASGPSGVAPFPPIAVAWPQAFGPDNSRILMRMSFDGGVTWSPRIDIADDAPDAANQHDHVTLAWLDDGRLFVGWRDHRCCGGPFTSQYQQWVRVFTPSAAGAYTPGPTVEFTNGPSASVAEGRGSLQPDEFQGLVATPVGIGLTWSQLGDDGLDHLMFRRRPLRLFDL